MIATHPTAGSTRTDYSRHLMCGFARATTDSRENGKQVDRCDVYTFLYVFA